MAQLFELHPFDSARSRPVATLQLFQFLRLEQVEFVLAALCRSLCSNEAIKRQSQDWQAEYLLLHRE